MSKRSKLPGKSKRYEVGYGKPPVEHRFKPGRSGNPKGRPKPVPNISEIAARALKKRRKITIDGKLVSVTTAELLVMRQINDAVLGNDRSFRTVFQVAAPVLRKELSRTTEIERIKSTMTEQEAADLWAKTMAQPSYEDEEPTFMRDKEFKK